MAFHRAIAAAVGLLALPLFSLQAQAAELKVLQSNALKSVMDQLGPQFEKATENKLVVTVGTTAQMRALIDKGETFDVAIFTKSALDDLAKQGKVADGPVAVARAGIGVAVRKGVPKPDVSTVEAFKQTMLKAASVGYVKQTPTAGNMKVVYEKLGITEQMQPKIKLLDVIVPVAVDKGEVEIGLTQISEIVPYATVELAGPLPAEIQTNTVFGAGISAATNNRDAAAALVKFLTSPPAAAVLKAGGMDPS
jgi:molybdate transport system substrate-binding protein